jgi:hypothetical protein
VCWRGEYGGVDSGTAGAGECGGGVVVLVNVTLSDLFSMRFGCPPLAAWVLSWY